MLKKILAVLAMLYAAAAFAAVDVNTAKASDLDGIKGIGPVISQRILDERKKGKFKDWTDLVSRVKGLGDGTAAKLSAEGLTVNGDKFKAASTKSAEKAEKKEAKAEKKDAKAEAKDDKKETSTVAAKPAASAPAKPAASAAARPASAASAARK